MAIRSQIEHTAELNTDWSVLSQPEQRATSSRSFDTDMLWLTFLSVNLLADPQGGYSFIVLPTQPNNCDSAFLQDSLMCRGSAGLPYLWHWLMETYSTSVVLFQFLQFLSCFAFVRSL